MRGHRWPRVIVALVPLLIVLGPASTAHAARVMATVTVLHALPGFTADVYVNGELTLSGFEPETATDPLELPAGEYAIEIRDVGAASDSDPALEGTVTLEGGQNLSIIAGLTRQGEPALNVFANDTARVAAGRSRFIVRNVSDSPSIGVSLDGDAVFRHLRNSDEAVRTLDAGTYSFEATAGDASAGPEDLVLEEGTVGIVYTVGSAETGTLDLMFQTVRGLQTPPGSVLTGDGGLAAPTGFPAWATASMVLGAGGAIWSLAVVIRRRSTLDRVRPG